MNRKDHRSAAFERDRGVCAECGLDTEITRKRLVELANQGISRNEINERMREEHGFHDALFSPLWQADHIVALWTEDDEEKQRALDVLENIQTLCQICHFAKTKGEAPERAKKKRFTPQRSKRCGDNHRWVDDRGQKKITRKTNGTTVQRCHDCRAQRPLR